MTTFYTYVYLDPTKNGNFTYSDYKFSHEPFYVGKGKGNQFSEHLRIAKNKIRTGRKGGNYRINKIMKILREGEKPIIIKNKISSEEEAFRLEKEMITQIGRKDLGRGPLVNLTDGGEGISGFKQSEEQNKANRIRNLGNKYSLGYKHTLEQKKANSVRQIGKRVGPKNSMWGKPRTEEWKESHSDKMMGNKNRASIYIITFPDGLKTRIKNLANFCREHSLDENCMYSVGTGKLKKFKGFQVEKITGEL